MDFSASAAPSGPNSRPRKVSTRFVLVLVTSRAATDLPVHDHHDAFAGGLRSDRNAMASNRFRGPSASESEAGRCAPTRITGLALTVVKSRKYAVSSSVSVPCVTTIPAISGFRSSSFTLPARRSQISGVISGLGILEICST